MLYKILRRISISAIIIFSVVSAILISGNKKRFPEAKQIYEEKNSIDWYGCEITPIEKQIYTVDEYVEAFPNDQNYSYIKNSGKDYSDNVLVVVRIKVKNKTSDTVSFIISNMQMELVPCMAANGVPIISGKTKLAPGEESEQTGVVLYTSSQLRNCSIDKIKNEKVQLVLSYYPEKIALAFD